MGRGIDAHSWVGLLGHRILERGCLCRAWDAEVRAHWLAEALGTLKEQTAPVREASCLALPSSPGTSELWASGFPFVGPFNP